jgi:hypothetical protein
MWWAIANLVACSLAVAGVLAAYRLYVWWHPE